MSININRILNISATEYLNSTSKSPEDYEFRGVHAQSIGNRDVIFEFAQQVTEDTEVVVKYDPQSFIRTEKNGNNITYILMQRATGTALIPRPDEQEKKKE